MLGLFLSFVPRTTICAGSSIALMMGYAKCFVAGISAAILALLLVLVSSSPVFHRTPVDVRVTDFYFPNWMPLDIVKVLAVGVLYLWSHVSVQLVLLAFVVGFCWELRRVSLRTSISPR